MKATMSSVTRSAAVALPTDKTACQCLLIKHLTPHHMLVLRRFAAECRFSGHIPAMCMLVSKVMVPVHFCRCDMPRIGLGSGKLYSFHGGAGAIMSIGLLKAISFDAMEKCVKSTRALGEHA